MDDLLEVDRLTQGELAHPSLVIDRGVPSVQRVLNADVSTSPEGMVDVEQRPVSARSSVRRTFMPDTEAGR